MDLLTNYPAFIQDIEDSFKDLIQEFHLKLLELHEGCYLLEGARCNIRFTYDRGDISCHFKQVSEYQDSPGYGVWAVYRFLYPLKEASNKTERVYDSKLQLIEYSDVVKKLKTVLAGDFSWLSNFVKKEEKENKTLNFILSLDSENPISKKFWSQDISWQQDIEKYLNENNISL
jgi:hypothetical protein